MQKGVTLVELLIGLAIISITLSFAVPLWQTDYFFGNRIPIDNLHLSLIEENESE